MPKEISGFHGNKILIVWDKGEREMER